MRYVLFLYILIAIAIFANGSHAYAQQSERPLTVDDVIRIGLENNFDIRIARNEADIARRNRGLGTAEFLPRLDITGRYDFTDSEVETTSPFSFGDSQAEDWRGGISLDWTIFDGFRMFADRQRFNQLARLGQAQAQSQIEESVVQIASAFFNMVQQQQLLDVAETSMEISKGRLDREAIRNELGGASSTDLLEARVAYNTDRAAYLNQELNLSTARQDLNILLGRMPSDALAVEKVIAVDDIPWSREELTRQSTERNSRILAARFTELAADRAVDIEEAAFWPSLSLSTAYQLTDRTLMRPDTGGVGVPDIVTEEGQWTVGVNVTFNIFNGLRDRIALQNARVEHRNARLRLRDTELQVTGDVEEKYETFKKRLEIIELERENVEAAQRNLELEQERFNLGGSSSLDFRDAQENYIQAETALISARYQARIALLEIEQLIGVLPTQ